MEPLPKLECDWEIAVSSFELKHADLRIMKELFIWEKKIDANYSFHFPFKLLCFDCFLYDDPSTDNTTCSWRHIELSPRLSIKQLEALFIWLCHEHERSLVFVFFFFWQEFWFKFPSQASMPQKWRWMSLQKVIRMTFQKQKQIWWVQSNQN